MTEPNAIIEAGNSISALAFIAKLAQFGVSRPLQTFYTLSIPLPDGSFRLVEGTGYARLVPVSTTITLNDVGSFTLHHGGVFRMIEAFPGYCSRLAGSVLPKGNLGKNQSVLALLRDESGAVPDPDIFSAIRKFQSNRPEPPVRKRGVSFRTAPL